MKKAIPILILLLLAGTINAYEGQSCGSSAKCAIDGDAPYCLGDIGGRLESKTCRIFPGEKGDICSTLDHRTAFDACYGTLKCVDMEDKGGRCSECDITDHLDRFTGLWAESSIDAANDRRCFSVIQTCSCDVMDKSNEWRRYGRWTADDGTCDQCQLSSECKTGHDCIRMQDRQLWRCISKTIDTGVSGCCSDSDCDPGNSCYIEDKICIPDVVFTSTTTSTTTTTTTTTTTLYDAVFNCDILVNISQGIDDGYEVINGPYDTLNNSFNNSWLNDGSLPVSNTTNPGNYSHGLIFRNVPLPNNLQTISATLFYNIKNKTGSPDFEYSTTYGTKNTTYQNLNNQTKPSQIQKFNSQDRTTCTGTTCQAISTAGSEIVIVFTEGEDEWLGKIQPNIQESLVFYNQYRWQLNQNLTVINSYENEQTQNLVFYSYDDDPTKAPRLCLNYTTRGYTPSLNESQDTLSDCFTDGDCNRNEYCSTGWNPYKECTLKQLDFLQEINTCFRNHECQSGQCSTHSANEQAGDYPEYNQTIGQPYISGGICAPPAQILDADTIPKKIVIGETLTVFASVKDRSGAKINLEECFIFYEKITTALQENLADNGWAYDSYGGNYSIGHTTTFDGVIDPHWTEKTEYTQTSQDILTPKYYGYYFECFDGLYYNGIQRYAQLVRNNYSSIKIIETPTLNPKQHTQSDIIIQFLNATDNPLKDATCTATYGGSTYDMDESTESQLDTQYRHTVLFGSTGEFPITIACNHSFYTSREITSTHYVKSSHCENGYKDANEDGVDCGGDCLPCDIEGKLQDFKNCSLDTECLSGFCHPEFKYCSTSTCTDNFRNQGEYRTDCGGTNCPQCKGCYLNNDCSDDGSSFCNAANYDCQSHTCTEDANCTSPIEYYDYDLESFVNKITACDLSDGLCKFTNLVETNETQKSLGLQITPLSGININRSGTILNVFNCDDEHHGFRIKTNDPSRITYSFAGSNFEPALASNSLPQQFGTNEAQTEHVGFISELCEANDLGYGGFEFDSDRLYARINFRSCIGSTCVYELVDVIVFRHNLENSHLIVLDNQFTTGSNNRFYRVNATNRSIILYTSTTRNGLLRNITEDYTINVNYNHSQYTQAIKLWDVFYYRINSSHGEVYDGAFGNEVNTIAEYDPDKKAVVLNWDFKAWMIWPILVIIMIGVVIANYRINKFRNRNP